MLDSTDSGNVGRAPVLAEVPKRRDFSTSTTKARSSRSRRNVSNPLTNSRKRYSSNKSQLKKSIGFQLDFKALLPNGSNTDERSDSIAGATRTNKDKLFVSNASSGVPSRQRYTDSNDSRYYESPSRSKLPITGTSNSPSTTIMPRSDDNVRSESNNTSTLRASFDNDSSFDSYVPAQKNTKGAEDASAPVDVSFFPHPHGRQHGKRHHRIRRHHGDGYDSDEASVADTVNQRLIESDKDEPNPQLFSKSSKLAEIVDKNGYDLLIESSKLSRLALDLRKTLVSDFADPNYNTQGPMNTYDVKALNSQYSNRLRELSTAQSLAVAQAINPKTMPVINQSLNVKGDLINHNEQGNKQKPLLISKATLMRAERVKVFFESYYMYLEKYQQPFKVNPLSLADDGKGSDDEFNDAATVLRQNRPNSADSSELGEIEINLLWNPLQLVRNRKAIIKSEGESNNLEKGLGYSHPLASTAFSRYPKKKVLWEISNEEIVSNYYWTRRNWFLVKNSRGQLLFRDFLKNYNLLGIGRPTRRHRHHYIHGHHRRNSSSASSGRRNSVGGIMGYTYRNGNGSNGLFTNHFNKSNTNVKKAEKPHNSNTSVDNIYNANNIGTNGDFNNSKNSPYLPLPIPFIKTKSFNSTKNSTSNSSINSSGNKHISQAYTNGSNTSMFADNLHNHNINVTNDSAHTNNSAGNNTSSQDISFKEPMFLLNDQEIPLLKESSRLDNVSSRFKRLSQNKGFGKFKKSRSRDTHTTTSGNSAHYNKSNEMFIDADYDIDKSFNNLDIVSPTSEQDTLSPDAPNLNYNKANHILGNVLIEPISRRKMSTYSSVSSLGMAIDPNAGHKNPDEKEAMINDEDYNESFNDNNDEKNGDFLSPNVAVNKKQALNFDGNEEKINEIASMSTMSSHYYPSMTVLNEIKDINTNLLVISNHLEVQHFKYTKLFELDKLDGLNNSNRLVPIPRNSLFLLISHNCTFKQKYDHVNKSFEQIRNLIPIYLKSLTKEVEHLSKLKSRINNDHSDKIDMLLSLSDRLVSNINTKLLITLKNIYDKLAATDKNTLIVMINKNEIGVNKVLFTVLEYFIIGLLYFTWSVLSVAKIAYKTFLFFWRIVKWIFW